MKLLTGITPEILEALGYAPRQDLLRGLESEPRNGMVYATPSACAVRIGHELFFGGIVTPECLAYIKSKILTFEIYEKYGEFNLFYPDEAWRGALASLFAGRCETRGSMISLDLRGAHRNVMAPNECDVLAAVKKHLPDVMAVSRVPKGASLSVYQARTPSNNYFVRFLTDGGIDVSKSFAAEITAHKMMANAGVIVPRVVAFEHKEASSGFSMMIAEEIPGVCMEEIWPDNNADGILREAGRQLALIHTIPVEGFGWIDRNSYDKLKGEKNSFSEYFDDYLADDLTTLNYYDFTNHEKEQIRDYINRARSALDVPDAALVHGDFDVSQIFYSGGRFTGFIDFGEIRGNNRLFDLAIFAYNDASPDRTAYKYLIDGYRESARLTDDDLYAVELMALFILLRFAGKKVETNSKNHWLCKLKRQLDRLNTF